VANVVASLQDEIFLAYQMTSREDSRGALWPRGQIQVSYNFPKAATMLGEHSYSETCFASLQHYCVQELQHHTDFRFDVKTFMSFKTPKPSHGYDGFNPLSPRFCYLKPFFNDPMNRTLCSLRKETLMNGFEMILPFLKPIEHLILDDTSVSHGQRLRTHFH